VEIDEAFLGGKNKNRHWNKKLPPGQGQIPVLGLFQRNGILVTQAVPNTKRNTLVPIIRELVSPGTMVFTDGSQSYHYLYQYFDHQTVNHEDEEYVRGPVHTNSLEGI
jgi:ISXO2 transposase-like protein